MRSLTLRTSLLSAAVAVAGSASAVIAFSPMGGVGTNNGVGYSLGYSFSIDQPGASLTGLGFYDEGGDGLATSHDIGIYTSTGTLVASATVAAGTSDTLLSGFRYNRNIAGAVLLAPGNYVIATVTGSQDAYLYRAASVNPGAGIAYGENRYVKSPTLAFPTTNYMPEDFGYFGANFTYEVAPVPEPASIAALGVGVVALVRRRRKG